MKRKKIICLDMDGTCSKYENGWQGIDTINDTPVDGLFEWLLEVSEHFDVHVFSSRSENRDGIRAMQEWFQKYGELSGIFTNIGISEVDSESVAYAELPTTDDEHIVFLYFPATKPPAHFSLDDRAERFTGVWPSVEHILLFEPWHKTPNIFPEDT